VASDTVDRQIWIIAGEASGDRYGALLARELHALDAAVAVRGMGGKQMAEAGVDILVDSSELGVVGLVEVLKHLREFKRLFWMLVARAEKDRPDAVVLIDYPGFNLRFARQMHSRGIKVVYYVCPQVWAWGRGRIGKIAQWVTKLLAIFPFEPDVFAGTGLDVEFVGHPLLEIMARRRRADLVRDDRTVLLLPGSRQSEVSALLPVMLDTALHLAGRRPDLHFVVSTPGGSVAATVREMVERHVAGTGAELDIEVSDGRTDEWMQRASAGLAASGTVTLEAAILGLPLVVAYRLNTVTYWLVRMLVKIPYFTIVNLIVRKLVFEEFLQHAASPENLAAGLEGVLPGGGRRNEVLTGMEEAVAALGQPEGVARRVARAVLSVANRQP